MTRSSAPARKTVVAAISAAVFVMGSLAACSTQTMPSVIGDGDQGTPSATLTDWKSYGDAVVTFTVTAERGVPEDEQTRQTGEGLINRSVTIHVDDVLWSRADAELPQDVDLVAWGWTLHGGARTPTVARGEPRLEVGHAYLAALARFADGAWNTLGDGAAAPFDDGTVGHGEWSGNPDHEALPGSALGSLLGLGAGRVTDLVLAAATDPIADRYPELDPVGRYQKVLEVKRSTGR